MQHVCVILVGFHKLEMRREYENREEKNKSAGTTLRYIMCTQNTLCETPKHTEHPALHTPNNKKKKSPIAQNAIFVQLFWMSFIVFLLLFSRATFCSFSEIFNRLGCDHIVSHIFFFCSISNSIENNVLRAHTHGKKCFIIGHIDKRMVDTITDAVWH